MNQGLRGLFSLSDNDWRLLALSLLPFLLLCAYSLQFNAYSMDEYTYMRMARSFAADPLSSPEPSRFPAFPFALSLAFGFFGDSLLVSRLVSVLFGALSVALVFLVGRRFFSSRAGFVAALLLGSAPFFAFLSSKILTESMFTLLFVACAYLVVESATRPRLLVPLGALFSLFFLARFTALSLVPIALFYW